jgi:arylsulfatase A-like enzyme
MKPNILFFIIDSFRADRFHGRQKTSVTPVINDLIRNGTYFNQAVSSADGTILSWSSIFTAKYPFKTGIRSSHFNKLNKEVTTYFEVLKKNGYSFYAYLPVLSETVGLFPDFDNDDCFYDFFLGISNGLGEKIIRKLDSVNMQEPWFFLIHAMDLHPPIVVPKEFDDKKFGANYYEKKVSVVDAWINNILKHLDLEKTIMIISADHGSYVQSISVDGEQIETNPNANLQIAASKIAGKIPKALQPLKDKMFFLREKMTEQKKQAMAETLNLLPHEKRAILAGRADKDHFLFDDKIRVPLLFVGCNVPKSKVITTQVRTVDIFPTISDIIGVESIKNTDGRSLLPLMEGKSLSEAPIYIESNPLVIKESNDVIGIRTSDFKYFRDKNDAAKRIHLYDLNKDPFEDHNISEKNPQKVQEMEGLLQQILKEAPKMDNQESDEESEEIARELRKLGYL